MDNNDRKTREKDEEECMSMYVCMYEEGLRINIKGGAAVQ